MPPETGEVRIAEQNVMTVRIAGDGMAYCSLGEEVPRRIALYEPSDSRRMVLSGDLRSLLREQTAANRKMVIVVKISEKAKYRNLVDLIDELNLMKIDRFSLDDYTDQDEAAIKGAV